MNNLTQERQESEEHIKIQSSPVRGEDKQRREEEQSRADHRAARQRA